MHVNKRLIKDTLDNAAVFFIAVILFIGALAALSVFGGEIMGFFGFTYNSVRSVTIFFVVGASVLTKSCSRSGRPVSYMFCWQRLPQLSG